MISKGNESFWSFNNIDIGTPQTDEHTADIFGKVLTNLFVSSDAGLIKTADTIMGAPPFWVSMIACLVTLIIVLTPVAITNNMSGAQVSIATVLGIAFSFLISIPVRTLFTNGPKDKKS